MSLRDRYRFTSICAQDESYIVAIRAPNAEGLAKGFHGFSLEVHCHSSSICHSSIDGLWAIQAAITVKQAETLAMRILEACHSARIAACEIDYRWIE